MQCTSSKCVVYPHGTPHRFMDCQTHLAREQSAKAKGEEVKPWSAPHKEPVWVQGVDVEGARWMMSRKKLSFTSPASHPLSTGQADPDM